MKHKLLSIFSSPSNLVILFIVLFVFIVNNNQKPWTNKGVIKYDIISYYAYLPATFIEKDINLGFITDANEADYGNQNKYWPVKTPDGKRVIKTTMGMAVLYAPFFFIAHASAPSFGYEPDGFSLPYQLAIQFSGLFYLFLGLILLKKIVLQHYAERTTAITLVAIYFGTNLVCYSTLQAAFSHQYTFFLFSGFIYYVVQWVREQKAKYALLLGLFFGMLILVRSVNIVFGLVFLLYNVSSFRLFKERLVLMLKNYLHVVLIGTLCFLVFLPQLLYWKSVSGNYFFNSYVGEWFYFSKPHLVECLVGFRKGWLIYSPIFIFSIAGIYFMFKTKHPMFVSTIILAPLYYYILSSWWCWWYGGSFGFRPMIDMYPLLAFPMAAFFNSLWEQKGWIKKSGIIALSLFVLLNWFQTIQFHYNVIHYDSMTFAAYKNRFWITTRADADKSLLRRPDYESAKKGVDATVTFTGE